MSRWVSWEESDPEQNWDVVSEFFRFIFAPILAPVTLGTAVYDYMEGTSHLDRKETIRNTLLWSGFAGVSWGYHALMFPGQYSYLSPSNAFKTAGYLGGVPLVAVLIATAAAVGYAETSDVHGAAAPNSINLGVPVGSQFHTQGSSTDIYPDLKEHPFWPWNW